ncbi:uncharacterized mitochondrial protein AtMg00810-like [Lathyrus oleraceus]|uniref:uncharacterized mitochondrial protein AtMg00810-like n=1 Tax=Pisum sativum TaxID=3888 RepID=UPI0021CE8C8F|nr:uncharacterized mitochondrial protein AtMg00810-like [Pisum sativum]
MTLPPGLSRYGESKADHSLYIKKFKHEFTALFVYVDDVVLAGFEIAKSPNGSFLNQRKYALELFEDAGLLAAKPSAVPFNPTLKLSTDEGNFLEDPSVYRRLIGRLIYLTNSRLDIAFAVQHVSQYVSKPRAPHYQAAIQILRYLKFVPAKGIFFSSNSKLQLFGFADSDWARCPDTRKSVTGYSVMLGSSLLCWKSKKQHTVSRSSTEAEYRALPSITYELQWLHFLFQDFLVQFEQPAFMFSDSKYAVYLAHNPTFHERSKHIVLDCYVIREYMNSKLIHLLPISTHNQLAVWSSWEFVPSTAQLEGGLLDDI